MTHSMHRHGTKSNLCDDYVILIMANFESPKLGDAQQKLEKIWEILSHYKAELVNYGTFKGGGRHEKSIDEFKRRSRQMIIINAVFKSAKDFQSCLKEIKEGDFGISITISGPFEEVNQTCAEIGLFSHTVQHSLGISGKTELLPEESVLEIASLCGHAMATPNLVAHLIERIRAEKITITDAANELSATCECGAFNPYRAEKILKKITATEMA